MARRSHHIEGPVGNLSYRRGFTLLEVMLALAILVGVLAVLGEFARTGLRHAKTSRDLTRAELHCESVMSQIAAGILTPDPVSDMPITDPVSGASVSDSQMDDAAPWVYSIESQTIDEEGLLAVTVTVTQAVPPIQRPTTFTLVRWMIDPNLEYAGAIAAASAAATQGSSSGSSTQGTSTGTQ
jgi:general secretion pathway protein I